jgi:hypothetical protein
MKRGIVLCACVLSLAGCALSGEAIRESPMQKGFGISVAPRLETTFMEGDDGKYDTSLHPRFGLSRIGGWTLLSVGGQARWDRVDGPQWFGGEASYLSWGGYGGYTIGALGGYDLDVNAPWPISAFGYLGLVHFFNTGFYARIGVEVKPPQLVEFWEGLIGKE